MSDEFKDVSTVPTLTLKPFHEKYDGTRSETVDQIYIKSGSGR